MSDPLYDANRMCKCGQLTCLGNNNIITLADSRIFNKGL